MTEQTKINLAALVPYPPDTTPTQRFRIEQWIPHLAAQGIRVDIFPFADEAMLRKSNLIHAHRHIHASGEAHTHPHLHHRHEH